MRILSNGIFPNYKAIEKKMGKTTASAVKTAVDSIPESVKNNFRVKISSASYYTEMDSIHSLPYSPKNLLTIKVKSPKLLRLSESQTLDNENINGSGEIITATINRLISNIVNGKPKSHGDSEGMF